MNYSIGITTYEKRFEKYFKPLIKQIKKYRPEAELIITINGEHNQKFNESYKKEILTFINNYSNIYPIIYPNFRSLSKLWNNCLINSSNDRVLILNDDITIESEAFFDKLEHIANNFNGSFKINGSWSHSFLNRKEINEVGWFDERYLGIGEEDGDFEWRWQKKYNTPFRMAYLPNIINHVDQNECLIGMKKANNKYSKFNLDFSHEKYKESEEGFDYGIMGKKLICVNENPRYHQAEKFYWENKDKL